VSTDVMTPGRPADPGETGRARQPRQATTRATAPDARRPVKPARRPRPDRPASPVNPASPVRPPSPARPAGPGRTGRTVRTGGQSGTAGPVAASGGQAGTESASASASAPRINRTSFIVLVLGLLGGGLICLLVVNTTLAANSVEISNLQQANAASTQRVQQLEQQVTADRSAAVIEREAIRLGMRPDPVLTFIDLATGTIRTGQHVRAATREGTR